LQVADPCNRPLGSILEMDDDADEEKPVMNSEKQNAVTFVEIMTWTANND
jgi:hypothetical protein